MKHRYGFALFIAIIISMQMVLSMKEQHLQRTIRMKVDASLKSPNHESGNDHQQTCSVQSLKHRTILEESFIQDYIKTEMPDAYRHPLIWHSGDETDVIGLSALGTDRMHHFSNSYMSGFLPFYTDQLWIPQYTISIRMHYRRDSEQYAGLDDVWQSSTEAFRNIYGDCEDHAILLADWLIQLGLDARVVLGQYNKEGHAWVIVFREDQVFLLEATNKQKIKNWRHYPLAAVAYQYHPEYMFNHEYFWVNTGSILTTNYQSMDWIKRSRFVVKAF